MDPDQEATSSSVKKNSFEDFWHENKMSASSDSAQSSALVDPTVIFGPKRDSIFILLSITILYSLILITGSIGNLLTCLVIIRNKILRTATNYYLCSLAISDLILLVTGLPLEMYLIWVKLPYLFGHSFCVIKNLVAEASTNASVLAITLFTVERYLAICHPFVTYKMSKISRAKQQLLWMWIIAVGLALPQALQFGIQEDNGVNMCVQTKVIIKHSFELSTVLFFIIPLVLITVMYSLMESKIRSNNKTEDIQTDTSVIITHKIRCTHTRASRKIGKPLVPVVGAFFICWAPFHAHRLLAIYGTTENHTARSPIILSVYSFLTYASVIFCYLSTCINPILYHMMSKNFRDAFKNTIKLWCHRPNGKTAGKRCSNRTQAFARNHIPCGLNTSKKTSKDFGSCKEGPKELLTHVPTVHVCKNVKMIVTPIVHDYRTCKEAVKTITEENRNSSLNTSNDATYDETSCSPVCGNIPLKPETIKLTPELFTNSLKENRDNSADEPQENPKVIKIKIMQREKEYG